MVFNTVNLNEPFAGCLWRHQNFPETTGQVRAEDGTGDRDRAADPRRQQRRELVPDGVDDACFDGGHGNVPHTESVMTFPYDRRPVPACHLALLAQALSEARSEVESIAP